MGTYQRGEPRQVNIPVASAKAVANGNLVGVSGNTLVNAADTAWNTDIATTQTAFALLFAGVAQQDKDANKNIFGNGGAFALKMRTATGGVFRFACKAGTYNLGDYVGPAKDTGNALLSDTVDLCATEARAIGKVVGGEGVNPGFVDVEILSRVFRAAPSIT